MITKYIDEINNKYCFSARALSVLTTLKVESDKEFVRKVTKEKMNCTPGAGRAVQRELLRIKDIIDGVVQQPMDWKALEKDKPDKGKSIVVYGFTLEGGWDMYSARLCNTFFTIFESIETAATIINVKYWLPVIVPEIIRKETKKV